MLQRGKFSNFVLVFFGTVRRGNYNGGRQSKREIDDAKGELWADHSAGDISVSVFSTVHLHVPCVAKIDA